MAKLGDNFDDGKGKWIWGRVAAVDERTAEWATCPCARHKVFINSG